MTVGPVMSSMKTWRYMAALAWYKRGAFFLNMGWIIGVMLFGLVPGFAQKSYFDWLSHGSRGNPVLTSVLALLIGSSLGRMTCAYGCGFTNIPFVEDTSGLLRKNLLRNILNAPGARALPGSPGEAVNRFRDDAEENSSSLIWFNDLIALAVFSCVSITVMARINVGVTLGVCLPIVLIVLLGSTAGGRVETYRHHRRQATGAVTGFLGEVTGGVQAVQVAGAEEEVTQHFRRLNEVRRVASLKDRLFEEVLRSIYRNSATLGLGLVLILASKEIRAGNFTIGDLALFAYFFDWIAEFAAELGRFIARYRQMGVSFGRMGALLQGVPPEVLVEHGPVFMRGRLPELQPVLKSDADNLELLEVRNLGYRYPESGRGIEGVDLRIRQGEFVVITGRIGSGKTTLLRALLGLVTPDEGEVTWNGEQVQDLASFMAPPRCSYTPQAPRLFSETLRDNVLLGVPEDQVNLPAVLEAAVLEADLAEMPAGLDTLLGPRGVRLSGGQIQRVAAARMFARDASLIVCDDLSSALDVQTEQTLWERAFARHDGTFLVVSHRPNVLRRADRILLIVEGRVDDEGTLDELLSRSEEMRRLWRSEISTAGNLGGAGILPGTSVR